MTQQEITEGNKLIAEFMELKVDAKYSTIYIVPNHLNQHGTNFFHMGNLRYHESWDWLMPVVEKIGKIKDGMSYSMRKQLDKADLWIMGDIDIFISKDDLWQAVVEFIKWQNKNATRIPA